MKKFIVLIAVVLSFPLFVAAETPGPLNPAYFHPPIRVACLGDSITHGVGASGGWAYPDQLDRMLGNQFDVRNYGHSGATVGKGDKHAIWGTKEYKDALAFHPDVVVVMLGTNDTKPENWAAKKDFPKLYKELIVSFQKLSSKPRVFCCTAPYVAKKGNFGINEAGVVEQMPMIRDTATAWEAAVIDVHAALEGKDELFGDNVHPKTEGATIIAKAVYQGLLGKPFDGPVPAPRSDKSKSVRLDAASPGELTYRDAYALIAIETNMPPDVIAPLREKFDATAPIVETHIKEQESQIAEFDAQRMKYKHAKDPDELKLSGEYRGKENAAKKALVQYKREKLYELIGLIPTDYKAAFGTGWVNKYILDRLTPIAATLTPEQRKQIREFCRKEGTAYGNINNTPERSIEDVETYREVYDKVLDAEQKKRVEPK